MIPKGLVAGETFTDGKYTFQVLEVQGNGNYLSTRINPENAPKSGEKEVVKEVVEETKTKAVTPKKTATKGKAKK